jgi:hypothetical protein
MQGSMRTVIDCLLALRARFMPNAVGDNFSLASLKTKSRSPRGDASSRGQLSPLYGDERWKVVSDSKFQRVLRTPIMSGIVVALALFLCARMHVHVLVYMCFKIALAPFKI